MFCRQEHSVHQSIRNPCRHATGCKADWFAKHEVSLPRSGMPTCAADVLRASQLQSAVLDHHPPIGSWVAWRREPSRSSLRNQR